MYKYWKIYLNTLASTITYRTNILLNVVIDLIPIAGVVILWSNIFTTNGHIGNYSMQEAIFYYLLTPLAGFITWTEFSRRLGYDIKNGVFSNRLIKPIKIWGEVLSQVAAYKTQYFLTANIFYIAILIIVYTTITTVKITTLSVALFILWSFLALALHILMDYWIASLAFWVDEVWSFMHFKLITFSLLGGVSFPLDILTPQTRAFIELLPFKFMYFVPISYLQGKRDPHLFMLSDIVILLAWALTFLVLNKIFWKRGLKKYGAYGN
jgi:ABC-2 type transport system permease protein